MFTVIDTTEVIRGGNIQMLGKLTRKAALEWAAECGGREITEGPEAGIIWLSDEGHTIAIPHDVPDFVDQTPGVG